MSASPPKAAKTVQEDSLRGAILGFGNPLLDISAPVDSQFLSKYELASNNAILAEAKHQPLYAELVTNYKVEYIAGGATQNSIRTAQWMLGAEGATSFVGSVGSDDDFAATLKQAAAKVGVKTLYYESMEAPTGTCAVLITGNERSLVTNLAAANAYKHAHVETPAVAKAIADARLYYSAGFFLTVPEGPKTIHQVAKHAAAENKIYCTNLSAPFIVQFFNQHVLDVMPYVDFLFCNEAEGGEFAKKMEWPHQDLKQVALKMAELPKENAKRPRVVVFTQGSDPTIVASQGKVTEYAVPHLDAKLIVDTNGAGDAFVGGFLAALIKDRPVEECVKAGQYAARVIIQRSGCTFPDHKPAFP